MTLSILEDFIDAAYSELDTLLSERLSLVESVNGALDIIDYMLTDPSSEIDTNKIYETMLKDFKASEDESYTNLHDNINKVNDFLVNSYGKYWKTDVPEGFNEFMEYLLNTCTELREFDDVMSALGKYIELNHDLDEGNYEDDDDSDDSINTEEINDR